MVSSGRYIPLWARIFEAAVSKRVGHRVLGAYRLLVCQHLYDAGMILRSQLALGLVFLFIV